MIQKNIFDESLVINARCSGSHSGTTIHKHNNRNIYDRISGNHYNFYNLIRFCVSIPKYGCILYAQVDQTRINQLVLINFSNQNLISSTNIRWFIEYLQDSYFLNQFYCTYDLDTILKTINIVDIINNPDLFINYKIKLHKSVEISLSSMTNLNIYNLTILMTYNIFTDIDNIKDVIKDQLVKILKLNNQFQKLLSISNGLNISNIFKNGEIFNFATKSDINLGISFLNNSNIKSHPSEIIINKFYTTIKFLNSRDYKFNEHNLKINIKLLKSGIIFYWDRQVLTSTLYESKCVCCFIIMGILIPIDKSDKIISIISILNQTGELTELIDKIEFFTLKEVA